MAAELVRPTHEALVSDLKELRQAGIAQLRALTGSLDALRQVAALLCDGQEDAPAIETVLHRGIDHLGDGPAGEGAAILLGLARGTRGRTPTELRELATERLGYQSIETFRKKPEADIFGQLADAIFALCVRYTLLYGGEKRDGATVGESRKERFDRLLKEIESLTTLELSEFVQLLSERLGVPRTAAWGTQQRIMIHKEGDQG